MSCNSLLACFIYSSTLHAREPSLQAKKLVFLGSIWLMVVRQTAWDLGVSYFAEADRGLMEKCVTKAATSPVAETIPAMMNALS